MPFDWRGLQVGQIIRYRYMWAKEAAAGRDAVRFRPCIVIQVQPRGDHADVTVVPVTHTPQHDSRFMLVPQALRGQLGLDGHDQYVVVSELNAFRAPTLDLAPEAAHTVTPGFMAGVRHAVEALTREGTVAVVAREAVMQQDLEAYRKRRVARARDQDRER